MKIRLMYLTLIFGFFSCKKTVDVGLPKTQMSTAVIFSNDGTASAAMAAIYANMASTYAGGGQFSTTFTCTFVADEMSQSLGDLSAQIIPTWSGLTNLWDAPYKDIYKANAILEGLTKYTGVSETLKKQLIGEARFVRAFNYFYLINLFGDVPLALTTNYQINAVMPRTSKEDVYQQILDDLQAAQLLLPNDYAVFANERARPNKWAATSLLARVYLYRQDWVNAEIQASTVIANEALYNLVGLDKVFLKNSKEAIWQISKDAGNTADAKIFSPNPNILYNSALSSTLTSLLTERLQPGDPVDQRIVYWTVSLKDATGDKYFFASKYKNISLLPITEYSMVLRLAEQYLIRAEARARQDKIDGANGAQNDLNAIRIRAGLNDIEATTKADVLKLIANERLKEFFTEWGHRWFDLKRTGLISDVLGKVKPNWKDYQELFPIPQTQILNNPSMSNQQNKGYN